MTTLSIAQARNRLADTINRVAYGGERIIFERRGKPVAALVSAEDLDTLRRVEDTEDLRDALKAVEEYERDPSKAMTYQEFRRKIGLTK